jgi:septum formation protein
MLLQELLVGYKLVLASGSPRRKELLGGLNIPFEVWPTEHDDESFSSDMDVNMIPQYLARKKSLPFTSKLGSSTILITSDTIVVCNGLVLGKPADIAEAKGMLKLLSGNMHTVVTGVCISSGSRSTTFQSSTNVYFRNLSTDEIDYYIEHYSPLDKAGAYGIQEWIGYIGIERIEGSYFNVMGLPVQRLYVELVSFLQNNNLSHD